MRRLLGLTIPMTFVAVMLTLTALFATVPTADVASAAEPTDPIYAIVAPVASPVCQSLGKATLLVPIVGGLVGERLALPDQVDVADLVLTALGPVYVVCGTLPLKDTSRCQLDDQIQALLPEQLDLLKPTPNVGGSLIDAVGEALKEAGLGDVNPLAPALKCAVPAKSGAVKAPPAPPPPASSALGALPSADLAPAPSIFSGTDGLLPSLDLTPTELPAISNQPGATLAAVVHSKMPSWLKPVQLVLALLLMALVAVSWTVSVREARRVA